MSQAIPKVLSDEEWIQQKVNRESIHTPTFSLMEDSPIYLVLELFTLLEENNGN